MPVLRRVQHIRRTYDNPSQAKTGTIFISGFNSRRFALGWWADHTIRANGFNLELTRSQMEELRDVINATLEENPE